MKTGTHGNQYVFTTSVDLNATIYCAQSQTVAFTVWIHSGFFDGKRLDSGSLKVSPSSLWSFHSNLWVTSLFLHIP